MITSNWNDVTILTIILQLLILTAYLPSVILCGFKCQKLIIIKKILWAVIDIAVNVSLTKTLFREVQMYP